MNSSLTDANNGTLRRCVSSERSRYLLSSSALNDVPLKVGAFTREVALVKSDTCRLPTSMSRITRNISIITHGSRACTVAERG